MTGAGPLGQRQASLAWMGIRRTVPGPIGLVLGVSPFVAALAVWLVLTWGEAELRVISPVILPSPGEVLGSLPSLLFERNLGWSVLYSLARVLAGFAVAAAVALPLGIAMGSSSGVKSAFSPVATIGSYLPIAALVPLTLSWFGTGELQKVMFLAIASFVLLLPLVVRAIDAVDDIFLSTAYTLGASRWQAIGKVLVPVALAEIYAALRLVIGVGWTYIILAEMIDAERGLGNLIITSQRRGPREHIYLVLVLIMVLAFLTDKLLATLGRRLFPYRRDT